MMNKNRLQVFTLALMLVIILAASITESETRLTPLPNVTATGAGRAPAVVATVANNHGMAAAPVSPNRAEALTANEAVKNGASSNGLRPQGGHK
jgi:hypothetical protein